MKQFTTSIFLTLSVFSQTMFGQEDQAFIHFSIDACMADVGGSNKDFSEFTSSSTTCSTLSVVGNNLYRTVPEENGHSCTPGVNGSIAMCVGADLSCDYRPNSEQAIRFDIQVDPNESGTGQLTGLEFYQKSPVFFSWINGRAGINNTPTKYAVTVLVNGQSIYANTDINATTSWSRAFFDFSSDPNFSVTQSTVFSFQLTPYCPNPAGGQISVWDIDELKVFGSSTGNANGGTLSGGPFTFCVGDSIPDQIPANAISLSGNVGSTNQWIVTDATGMTILDLPNSPSDVDFDVAGAGICLLWNLSHSGSISGLEVNRPVSGIDGCFSLSNSISITRLTDGEACQSACMVQGGVLTGGPFTFCIGDNVADFIDSTAITLSGNSGSNSQWVVTDESGLTILDLPLHPSDVNFEDAGLGTCLIWHLSYEGQLSGAVVNGPVSGLSGCFSLSNSIGVNRSQPTGGVLSGGSFTFCVGDGIADNLSPDAITVANISGESSQWIVTDDVGETILGLPDSPTDVNFDDQGPGVCLIWHISYNGQLSGAVANGPVSAISGCFDLSNSVQINRVQPAGGTISGGPFTFCVGDGIPDTIAAQDISITGQSGANGQWVVTDADTNMILGLPTSPSAVNFDDAGAGTCLLWHVAYDGELTGTDSLVSEIRGCFSLSNSISIVREIEGSTCEAICNVSGGTITGGPFNFCVGDGVSDTIASTEITLSGNIGPNNQWVVTDEQGIILGLPPSFTAVNFDDVGAGTCLIWHLSYTDSIIGAELGMNAGDIQGCLSLSNSISVVRVVEGENCAMQCDAEGGTITGGPFTFCAGDGAVDTIATNEIMLSGQTGTNSQWVVTDNQGVILGLPPSYESVEFDSAGFGTCLIWHMSFEDTLVGAEIGLNANDIQGCYSLSNSISVIRNTPNGGRISGNTLRFCVGDGVLDTIPMDSFSITGVRGQNSQWILTNNARTIIQDLPDSPNDINFDTIPAGTSRLWHISYYDTILGLTIDSLVANISGCFDFSNSLAISRSNPNGGELSGGPFNFCVGDSVADTIPANSITLTRNSRDNSQWVITDAETNRILSLPTSPYDVDFDGAGTGTCLIWHLSYSGELIGAEIDSLVSDLSGCYSLSNSIAVVREDAGVVCGDSCTVSARTISGGPFTFCVGDGVRDTIANDLISITGTAAENSQWVITNADTSTIIGLPSSPYDVNFDETGEGTCLIWHLSYEGVLQGAEVDSAVSGLSGCLALSNSISVIREIDGAACSDTCVVNPATISGGPFTFCVSDSIPDTIADDVITVTGDTATNSQWVITNADTSTILGLPESISMVDFDQAGEGTCLIWYLSYEGELVGADVDSVVSGLSGCLALSNPIAVIRDIDGAACTDTCNVAASTIAGGPFTFCVGDGIADVIESDSVTITGNTAANSQWLVTNAAGTIILGFSDSLSTIDFDQAGPGTCKLWNVTYDGELTGIAVDSLVSGIGGCYALSNDINVIRNQPEGGTITGGPFTFCVGDGNADTIASNLLTLNDDIGSNSQWVITNEDTTQIIGLPNSPFAVDFDNTEAGTCLIWHLAYEGEITGDQLDSPVSGLSGCFSLSNSISVIREDSGAACTDTCTIAANTIAGGPFMFCAGDSITDSISNDEITITGNTAPNSQWVITNADTTRILDLPDSISMVDFDIAGAGTCLIWYLSYEGILEGAEVDSLVSGLSGCFALSNSIKVIRSQPEGGEVTGGPFTFCAGDGLIDTIGTEDVKVGSQSGSNSQWVITDETATTILGLPGSPNDVNFDTQGAGTCLIWHLSYDGELTGLTTGEPVAGIQGCFDLSSNSITVIRNQPDGGIIEGGPFMFCVGDAEADTIATADFTLTGSIGSNSQWIVTDDSTTTILAIASSLSDIDFNNSGVGTCKIWHLSYDDEISGAEVDGPVLDLAGCFDLSNSIDVERVDSGALCDAGCMADGGTIEGGPFGFCTGDGNADMIPPGSIILTDMVGDSSRWVVTDDSGIILDLPEAPEDVNFDNAGPGTCLIYHISYFDGLTGLLVDEPLSGINGCFNLSNSLSVVRNQPTNATLSGGPFNFCIGDGTIDTIPAGAITVTGNTGANSQWIILDSLGTTIIGTPAAYEDVNFDDQGAGVCLIRHISYDGTLSGLEVDSLLTGLSGCFSLSNSISVNRTTDGAACQGECLAVGGSIAGGPFEFCVGDGLVDTIAMGVVTVTGNSGSNSSWVVTNAAGTTILGLPSTPSAQDFESAGVDTCLLWHLSSEGLIEGDTLDGPVSGIQGCYQLSNSITVIRNDSGAVCDAVCPTVGGSLAGGPFEFCVGDGVIDTIVAGDITSSGNVGSNAVWVVTEATGDTIVELPGSPSDVNFETLGSGSYLIWLLSFEMNLAGATPGALVADLQGCFSLSDSIVVTRNEPNGGTLMGGPFTFCSGDGIVDTIAAGEVTLSDNVGTGSQWIVTDASGDTILGVIDSPSDDNFDSAGLGICLLYHIGYTGEITGLTAGQPVANIGGCYDLSNSVEVFRVDDGDACDNAGAVIVINEIIFDGDGLIELKNVGGAPRDISSYFLCNFPFYERIGDMTINCGGDLMLAPGETVVVETSSTFVFEMGDDEMGLYLNGTDYADAANIIDYVEWGAGGHTRAPVAASAGIWTVGNFVPTPSNASMTLNYDGDGDAPSDWSEAAATLCDTGSIISTPTDRLSLEVLQNPINETLYFNVNMIKDINQITVDIHDIFGVRVKSETMPVDYYSTDTKRVDVSDLSQGIYFISVQENYGKVEAKVVIQ